MSANPSWRFEGEALGDPFRAAGAGEEAPESDISRLRVDLVLSLAYDHVYLGVCRMMECVVLVVVVH